MRHNIPVFHPRQCLTAFVRLSSAIKSITTHASLSRSPPRRHGARERRAHGFVLVGEQAQLVGHAHPGLAEGSGAGRVGRLSRMGERLPHIEPQLLRARLAHLHCRGRLQLDFADDDFGVALLQECLK